MSQVTDVLIMTIGEEVAIADLNRWLDEHAEGQQLCRLDTDAAGGRKTFGCDVWAMSGNYLPLDAFLGAFAAIRWDLPHAVVMLLDGDTEDATRVVRPAQPEGNDHV